MVLYVINMNTGELRHMSPDELAHHGVKGMKWGVRRERAKRARMGGRLTKRIEGWDNYISVREGIKKRNTFRGKSNTKLNEQLKKASTTRKNLVKLRDKTIAGLTQKEIDAGKRFADAMVAMGGAIGNISEYAITERFINKNV